MSKKPDPNCPDCLGAGVVIVAINPIPMGFPCICTEGADDGQK